VQVYLPDLKYAMAEKAKKYSAAEDYFEVATAAIREMFRQTGPCQFDGQGLLKRGVLIRHLVLPGCLDNTLGVIDWVAERFPRGEVLFSLMSQYVPMNGCEPPFDRRVTQEEYDGALSWMEFCGIQRGYTQDFSAATTEYLPEFDLSGLV
ncbi:MAG: radical SAM protein, partial [Oscillospiraceae bacterium]|nr:radical SAM protein [Oscillospiraceae bacterium]